MALYAFDGTGKKDDPDEDLKDTNVCWFVRSCLDDGERNHYTDGIGTRFGYPGRLIGGAFGVGGKPRTARAYDQLKENFAAGDDTIDIVGFSRGAALAVNFANVVHERGVHDGDGVGSRRIRFLGVWDLVGSFGLSKNILGIPFHDLNWTYRLDVPSNVDHCFHAMALDEPRERFNLTRLNASRQQTNIREVWFRGVHSDVGGGNQNLALSHIALKWMLTKAHQCGVPVDASAIAQLESLINERAPISERKTIQKRIKREIYDADIVHCTVQHREGDIYNNPPVGLEIEPQD